MSTNGTRRRRATASSSPSRRSRSRTNANGTTEPVADPFDRLRDLLNLMADDEEDPADDDEEPTDLGFNQA
jgi:hypothetical protein